MMSSLREAAAAVMREWESGVLGYQLDEAMAGLKAALAQEPVPPHEAQTDTQKIAYAAGWWAAMAKKAALAQEEQAEPVELMDAPLLLNGQPLYTAPPQRKQEQAEPVAWVDEGRLKWHIPNPQTSVSVSLLRGKHPLYTAPPQRKPLTDDEITALGIIHSRYQEESLQTCGWFDFARAVERAHGIGEKQ